MSWVSDIAGLFRRDSAMIKLILEELRKQKEEAQDHARQAEERYNNLLEEHRKTREGEEHCHRMIAQLSQQVRDLKEHKIFTDKLKP